MLLCLGFFLLGLFDFVETEMYIDENFHEGSCQ